MKRYLALLITMILFMTGCQLQVNDSLESKEKTGAIETTTNDEQTSTSETKSKSAPKEEKKENIQKEKKQTKTSHKQPNSTLTIHYIDVGQADATLFTYDNHAILFDTGDWKRSDTVEYLERIGVTGLDLIIISHPDADHIGQLPEIINSFNVDEVWMSGNESSSQVFQRSIEGILANDINYHEPRTGESFTIGALEVEVVHPQTISGHVNEESLSVHFTYGEHQFLFTGDADTQAETQMLHTNQNLKANVLHIGHHGSNTSSGQSFLDSVQPEIAIISVGENNSYGHPHPDILNRLENSGIQIYRTDLNGTIQLTTDGKNYSIKTVKTISAKKEQQKQPNLSPKKKKAKPAANKSTTKNCINLNKASVEELQNITHIGPDRAEQITKLRPFSSVEELSRVKGIGPARIKDIKDEGLACTK
ncbi:MAG TPA: MBL fold metallo-hydrolase [Cerasibacillus sp.]|uniref:MBL fold metallo-hydrolase n=1 Tax=Cerasibacillus sp. TaxID=2498711 RepID=UPI002F3E5134